MYLHFIDSENFTQYDELPFSIILPDGMTRTSLSELSIEDLNSFNIFYYMEINEPYDTTIKYWDGTYSFDHDNRKAYINVVDKDISVIKNEKLDLFIQNKNEVQRQGLVTTSNIKLQVEEEDLTRWTQLMTGMLAFSPETVNIVDFDNNIHNLTLNQAQTLLQEVFVWGQAFVLEKRIGKDAILNSNTIEELLLL